MTEIESELMAAFDATSAGEAFGVVVAGRGGYDLIGIVASSVEAAASAAAMIAGVEPAVQASAPDEVWERLSVAVRTAQSLRSKGRIKAAAVALKGRGRIVGPLRGDLLIRFGVSTWR